ncbi:A/G-specific adenine glycosylase [Croceimicrobium hydrocarbonivorans]|uniref:Adenine DNA glycosylase n=1 Tax=Croceimicrobium hydrocarbonivorans TaxID=2761580 RepID=A0A7H0VBL7_9FLAO|nr:A/G-specific adenine glycosylase [Croceimicrobium hydrocarbonivorans]QNR23115.1 A/G-specific adenine glycosylase [Croceimicrobium hydrocarbonivorans]
MDFTSVQHKLRNWYQKHYRPLPWRKTRDAYSIWLSEIILQQTRVNQGLPYYERFIQKYPEVKDLAQAPQEEVLKLWEGLGYYSRARNMHAAAQSIVEEHESRFPDQYAAIRSLKGVGDYTAAAIASFAFDLPHAVVDGNVQRVLSRFFAEYEAVNSAKGKKRFQALADAFLNTKDPATHNQAIMELGATLCKPKNPECDICPLAEACQARARAIQDELPVKQKKKYDRQRYLNYWFFQQAENTWLQQRDEGIWKGLFQFPLYESGQELTKDQALEQLQIMGLKSSDFDIQRQDLPVHKLSHQSLFITVWKLRLSPDVTLREGIGWKKVTVSQLEDFAIPRPLRKFLDENQLTLPLD